MVQVCTLNAVTRIITDRGIGAFEPMLRERHANVDVV